MIRYQPMMCQLCGEKAVHRIVTIDGVSNKNCLICENKTSNRKEMLNHPKAKPFTILARKRER